MLQELNVALGGTLGTAVFLSILFSQAGSKISEAFAAIAPTPAFQAALHNPTGGDPATNKAFVQQLQAAQQGGGSGAGVGGSALSDSSFINQLDPRLAKPFLMGFSEAMDHVFLVGAGVMVLGLVIIWFLPEVELRKGSAYQERNEADAETEAATTS